MTVSADEVPVVARFAELTCKRSFLRKDIRALKRHISEKEVTLEKLTTEIEYIRPLVKRLRWRAMERRFDASFVAGTHVSFPAPFTETQQPPSSDTE